MGLQIIIIISAIVKSICMFDMLGDYKLFKFFNIEFEFVLFLIVLALPLITGTLSFFKLATEGDYWEIRKHCKERFAENILLAFALLLLSGDMIIEAITEAPKFITAFLVIFARLQTPLLILCAVCFVSNLIIFFAAGDERVNTINNKTARKTSSKETKLIHCPHCGYEQESNRILCWKCARKLHEETASPTQQKGSATPEQKETHSPIEQNKPPLPETRIFCPKCGFEQPANRSLCWKCFYKFTEEDRKAALEDETTPSTPQEAQEAPMSTASAPAEEATANQNCPYCGKPLQKDALFCSFCGKRMDE